MARVELEHFPADRPPRVQKWAMVVPSCLDADPDHGIEGENLDNVRHNLRQRRPGHRAPRAGLEQRRPGRIRDRERELGLADINRNDDR